MLMYFPYTVRFLDPSSIVRREAAEPGLLRGDATAKRKAQAPDE